MPIARSASANLLAGTITRYGSLFINIGIGVFLMPFTVAHLGKAQYGLWMLVASITYYFSLLDLGYDSGLVRHIVDADTRGDVTGVNRIVSTFVCVYAAIGVVVCAATAVAIVQVVPRFPHLTLSDVATARVVMAILGARIAIGFPMTVFGAVTTARQGFALNNTVAIVIAIANGIVTYAVLESGGGLTTLVFWTTAVALVGYFGYAWSARRVFPELRIRPRYFSRSLWAEVTSFSLFLFFIDVASQVTFNLDNVLIGAFLGTSAVAVYAVAVRLSDYQRRLCDQFSGMLFPVAVGLDVAGHAGRLRTALVEGTRVAVVLVVGVTICLVGFSRPLITRWMGPGFEGSVAPFLVLACVGVVMVASAPQASILLATGKHRLVALVWVVEAAMNFVISISLVRPLGAVGVAIGTAIPIAIGHLGILTPVACRRVGLQLRRYVADTVTPAAAGAIPAILTCVTLSVVRPPLSIAAVLLEACLVGAIYVAAVVSVGLDDATRRTYWSQLTRVFRFAADRRVRGQVAAVPASTPVVR